MRPQEPDDVLEGVAADDTAAVGDAPDDAALVARVRAGDIEAFGELWRRHSGAVTAAARGFTGFDADDVTAEAFARVLRQVRAGGGPESAPRAYLVRTARNVAAEWARRDGGATTSALDDDDLVSRAVPDHAERVAQRQAARAAYERLPERWRQALWVREVEDLPVAECARVLGTTPNSATVLLKRAREGFAQEWIRENISRASGDDGECVWVIARLPRHARGKTTPGDAQRITRHLTHCRTCALNGAEARHLQERLVLVLVPALLLLPGAFSRVTPLAEADAVAAVTPATSRGSTWGGVPVRIAVPALAMAAATAAIVVAVAVASTPGAPARPTGDPEAVAPVGETTTHPPAAVDTVPVAAEEPAPAPTRAPVGPSRSPAPPAQHPEVLFVERALVVDPIASAAGLYPRLSGVATSGALVTVVLSAGSTSTTVSVVADASGAWALTPDSLVGTITASFTQAYTSPSGQSVTVDGPDALQFTVTQLADVVVIDTGNGVSSAQLTGPANATVEIATAGDPGFVGTWRLDASGQLAIGLNVAKSDAGPIRFRLVEGARSGPWGQW